MIRVFDRGGRQLADVTGDAVGPHLAAIGVDHGRWPVRTLVDPTSDQVLAAYAAEIDALRHRHGYASVDVVRITPDHPGREAARAKFRDEHTHDDDETRAFVEGAGVFYLHVDDRVHAVRCGAGDLLRVPAGIRHWFDMGARPSFCAIRLFTRPDGWVATFTGDAVSAAIPDHDQLVDAGVR
ncbi:MAG: cupin [Myxococcota bacterium]